CQARISLRPPRNPPPPCTRTTAVRWRSGGTRRVPRTGREPGGVTTTVRWPGAPTPEVIRRRPPSPVLLPSVLQAAKHSAAHATRTMNRFTQWASLGPGLYVRVPDLDRVAHTQRAALEDLGPQAGPVHKCAPHSRARQTFQVSGGLGEPEPTEGDVADSEGATDKVIQRDALGDDVAARLVLTDRDVVFAAGGCDGFAFDQRHRPLAVVGLIGVLAGAGGVAVTVEADSGDGADVVARLHRSALLRRRVDGDDLPSEHGTSFACGRLRPRRVTPSRRAIPPGAIRTSRGWSCTCRGRAGTATCVRRGRPTGRGPRRPRRRRPATRCRSRTGPPWVHRRRRDASRAACAPPGASRRPPTRNPTPSRARRPSRRWPRNRRRPGTRSSASPRATSRDRPTSGRARPGPRSRCVPGRRAARPAPRRRARSARRHARRDTGSRRRVSPPPTRGRGPRGAARRSRPDTRPPARRAAPRTPRARDPSAPSASRTRTPPTSRPP